MTMDGVFPGPITIMGMDTDMDTGMDTDMDMDMDMDMGTTLILRAQKEKNEEFAFSRFRKKS